MQISGRAAGAPFAVGIVVAGAGGVVERIDVGGGNLLCLIAGSIFSRNGSVT